MFTTWDKALTAIIMGLIYFANTYLGLNFGIDEALLNQIIVVLTPLLVWLVPNKKQVV